MSKKYRPIHILAVLLAMGHGSLTQAQAPNSVYLSRPVGSSNFVQPAASYYPNRPAASAPQQVAAAPAAPQASYAGYSAPPTMAQPGQVAMQNPTVVYQQPMAAMPQRQPRYYAQYSATPAQTGYTAPTRNSQMNTSAPSGYRYQHARVSPAGYDPYHNPNNRRDQYGREIAAEHQDVNPELLNVLTRGQAYQDHMNSERKLEVQQSSNLQADTRQTWVSRLLD